MTNHQQRGRNHAQQKGAAMFVKFVCPRALWTERETFHNPRSYEIPTLEAVRGMLRSIYWHPGIEYAIKKVQICSPIQYGSEKRNELKGLNSPYSTQKLYTFLKDYSFIVEFKIAVALDLVLLSDKEPKTIKHVRKKTEEILKRRIKEGKSGDFVRAGQMQFPCSFEAAEQFESNCNKITRKISKMYVCLDYNKKIPVISDVQITGGFVDYENFNLFSHGEVL